ncbi:large ribosomal RNA subunit accumulation protein YCED homolog 1, chloroplastic [Mercurialis annua]|uniref:large ribosomal RNA subunit accumulation protein YCED homolog 1, chloroplastic n=1 Tax=Mercurialis annua TaxID=3986 RepID=UPI00215F9ECF|nr:large ribosomal RNA subunit accumulation protein YCED homolog 1, chloroplastic [Mercurialis annua]
MSSVISTLSLAPSSFGNKHNVHNFVFQKNSSSYPNFSVVNYKCSWASMFSISSRNNLHIVSNNQKLIDVSLGWDDLNQQDPDDLESPWEGAIIYKRNPSVTHVEYCTTLERLGLENHSTEVSKSRASVMGLRVTKAVKDYPLGTPVQISIDVIRKKQKLRLDGIIKTVLTLSCNRCGGPAAESVYSNFSLLLSEEPIEEPEIIDLGTIFSQDKSGGYEEEEDDDASIDWDDRFYFPPQEKEIDISKNLRDLVHIEITGNAVCDPNCRGVCLECGTNLNTSSCSCIDEENKEISYGPLKDLRKQMQPKV